MLATSCRAARPRPDARTTGSELPPAQLGAVLDAAERLAAAAVLATLTGAALLAAAAAIWGIDEHVDAGITTQVGLGAAAAGAVEAQAPAPHAAPHAPQFEGSELVSAQVAPHSGSPAGHVQLPFWQWLPLAHSLPQPPQLLESVLVLAQVPLHKLGPVAQALRRRRARSALASAQSRRLFRFIRLTSRMSARVPADDAGHVGGTHLAMP